VPNIYFSESPCDYLSIDIKIAKIRAEFASESIFKESRKMSADLLEIDVC